MPTLPLLEIEDLEVTFRSEGGDSTPVTGVNLLVQEGRTTALVGESGSGKSVTSLAIMGLLPRPSGRITAGRIRFRREDGTVIDLTDLPAEKMRGLRGREIAMIFQEPMTSLNPVMPVGEQIAEQVRLHTNLTGRAALARATEMLGLVEIPDAKRRAADYPHQMSGGMRQRAMIALAMSCNPRLLIADEPTTALDVTIQSQILALIDRLRKEHGMGVLFITHNLGVVAEIADEVTVMYAGEVVESAPVKALFRSPCHPYTQALLDCLPARAKTDSLGRRVVQSIPGAVGNAFKVAGCRFAPRCAHALAECNIHPKLEQTANGRLVRCLRWSEL
jgi:peptide/nickel transport system ATP-binding protein